MLVHILQQAGIIHKEFVPPGHMVNKEYYVEVFSCLVQRIHQVRPQFQERESWFLLHNNERPHTAVLFGKTRDSRIKSLPIFS
jgi:hypothetical protein